jgi:hypothetical protein
MNQVIESQSDTIGRHDVGWRRTQKSVSLLQPGVLACLSNSHDARRYWKASPNPTGGRTEHGSLLGHGVLDCTSAQLELERELERSSFPIQQTSNYAASHAV